MNRIVSVDFETWNIDPISIGIHGYARRLKILMMAWHISGDPSPPKLWRPGMSFPQEIMFALANGGRLSGWNAMQFERIVWRERAVPDHGFPAVNDNVWLDSMFLAASANLPRGLDACAQAVGASVQKDMKGHSLMLRVTNGNRTPWPPKEEDITRLGEYCIQDVMTEEATAQRLPPWPNVEPWLHMPAIDTRVNDRGILMDVELVQGLARAAAIETARLDAEMATLTDGAVPKTTNIESLKEWLIANGIELPRTDVKLPDDSDIDGDEDEKSVERKSPWRLRKSDMADILARTDIPDKCRLAVSMRAEAAKASARKLKTMLACATSEGYLCGTLNLMGAQATGRWSSGRSQLHNMVRDKFPNYDEIAERNHLDPKQHKDQIRELMTLSLATAIKAGRTGDPDLLRCLYEMPRKDLQGRVTTQGVLPWISRMMRRTLCASAGHVLLNGDFSNIEARIPVWLAEQDDVVAQFARGEDVYRAQAAPVYGLEPSQLSSEQRQIGKVMRLFLGFMGGVNAFVPAAMNYGITIARDDGLQFVQVFRQTNAKLVEYCDMNLQCASWAVMYPGREFCVPPKGNVAWMCQDNCLFCRLPSGRFLRYWQPRLEQGYWEDGSPKTTLDLTVLTIKGKAVFRRTLWRGLAIENITQAIACDLLATALVNMEREGFPVRLHVHDSIAVEVDEDAADALLPRFKDAMLDMPAWVRGLPVAADTDASARFG